MSSEDTRIPGIVFAGLFAVVLSLLALLLLWADNPFRSAQALHDQLHTVRLEWEALQTASWGIYTAKPSRVREWRVQAEQFAETAEALIEHRLVAVATGADADLLSAVLSLQASTNLLLTRTDAIAAWLDRQAGEPGSTARWLEQLAGFQPLAAEYGATLGTVVHALAEFSSRRVSIYRIAGTILAAVLTASLGLFVQDRLRYRSKERLYTASLRSLPDGVILIDHEQRILLSTPAAQSALASELKSGTPIDQVSPQIARQIEAGRRAVFHLDLTIGARSFHISHHPVYPSGAEEKRLIGSTLVLRDITEWRKLEEDGEQQRRREQLEKMAAGVAHDVNNLLAAISGTIDLIELSPESLEAVRSGIAAMRVPLGRARELAATLTAYAGADANPARSIEIRAVLEEVMSSVSLRDGVAVSYAGVEPGICTVGNPKLVSRAVQEIIRNATEAVGTLGGSVTIDAEQIGGVDGAYVDLTVRDNGPGIPEEDLNAVFDPFFSRKPRHRGMGLSIAHAVARAHGGAVNVTSTSEGTTVSLLLPVDIDEQRE